MENPDLYQGYKLDLGKLSVQGLSLSGVRTTMAVPQWNLAIDVAQGFPFLFPLDHFFVTHVHLDHAAGIPYLIAQKNMYDHKPATFYMPASMVSGMTEIMRAWEKMEGHQYKYNFVPVEKGFVKELKRGMSVRAFPTTHRVDSFGYTLFKGSKKLKPEFVGKTEDECKELRRQGIVIQEFVQEPLMSFTGDTQIEFLNSEPWVKQSKYLFLEATYLDEERPIARAREWGHTHLDEIIDELPSIESEKIVLIHVSSRYSTEKALNILSKKIPKKFADRVLLFLGR